MRQQWQTCLPLPSVTRDVASCTQLAQLRSADDVNAIMSDDGARSSPSRAAPPCWVRDTQRPRFDIFSRRMHKCFNLIRRCDADSHSVHVMNSLFNRYLRDGHLARTHYALGELFACRLAGLYKPTTFQLSQARRACKRSLPYRDGWVSSRLEACGLRQQHGRQHRTVTGNLERRPPRISPRGRRKHPNRLCELCCDRIRLATARSSPRLQIRAILSLTIMQFERRSPCDCHASSQDVIPGLLEMRTMVVLSIHCSHGYAPPLLL